MMAIRRGRFHTPAYMSTKGHSVLSQRSYAMPSRTPLSTGVSRASSVAYDTRVEDYLLSERVNNVSYLSNSTLDMTDDTAKRSRGRDQQLLRDATQAIPRGSVRDTAAVTSSPSPFGPRRFPRRFGKAKLRSSQSSSFYATRLSPTRGKDGSTADLMASPGPAPSGSWRRPGTRSASVARSSFDSDYSSVAEKPTSRYRAHSVGPTSSRSLSMYRPSFPSPSPPPVSRRALPPLPSTSVSQSQVFGISRTGGSRSFPSSRSSYGSAPVHPGYDPLYVEYEPDTKPTPRRRQRVLASSRRPAGNYYERLLRKRGKNQGRFGPYYDVESIEGSDLSGVLSDVDSADGTYDGDNDLECSGVSSSSYRDHHNHHNHNDLSSSYSDSVSPSSPYYVDQDTEFVPFKPSRPLQTKGLLELSPLYDDDDEDDNESSSYSNALPSPTTDLSLSRYLPASLTPTPTASLSSSGAAASASGGISLPSLPYQTLVPYTTSPADDSLAVQSSPTPSQQLLESLVSSAVQRAKGALNDLAIPGYHGASLLLSVEGAGLSPEGKRVGFTYTPPPIPLFGRGLSLDEKLAGLRPLSVLKPVDHFLAGYMERMGALREALNDRLDKDKARRLQYGLKPLETGPRLSSRTSTPIPDYTQSYDYVPVRQLSSQKLERLPVTTFRRRQDDGRTQRLDVIPLGEIRPRLPSSSARAITIPESVTGGHKLSVLDKINIKAAIIASKLEPDPIKRRRPRSEFAANKYRSMRKEAQESVYAGTPQSSGLYSSVPPLPKPSERKAIRTDDGYSKPKNLLSWQYRLDAKMAPSDLLYQPSSFIRIREQLRDAQERMDRHRQMLDRYLPEGGADTGDVVSSIRRKMADMERRDPVIGGGADSRGATVNVPSSYASGVDPSNPPMSDLRRRIRKTLNKTRNSSVF